MSSEVSRLRALRRNVQRRAALLRAIRVFFAARRFLEIETPVRIPAPAQELHIDAERSGERFLRTSQELHMKRLLAAGYERIFQIGPCFRRGEWGARHHPEFTLLEWYRRAADYRDILRDTRALLLRLAQNVLGRNALNYQGQRIALAGAWECLTVRDAFLQHAGWNPVENFNEDRFYRDLVECVEPRLPADRPTVLLDYPAPLAALARRKPGEPAVAERWELYIGGLELANAFSELTDPREQRERFAACAAERRRQGKDAYPLDEAFLRALEAGLPPAGGIALGIDRLVMLFTDSATLDEVLPFRE
jgi:lysyl-tRNA synthetase class 2